MAEETIYAAVMKRTTELFGVAINPHMFRSIAATALARQSAEDRFQASALLGHQDATTTEAHYIFIDPVASSNNVTSALRSIRNF